MPTYEYRCPNGHDFEKFFRTISASERSVVCPVCGAMGQMHMSVSAGIVFKGSGFYATDYGTAAHAPPSGAAHPTSHGDSDQSKSSEAAAKPSSSDAGGMTPASTDSGKSTGGASSTTDAKSTPKKHD